MTCVSWNYQEQKEIEVILADLSQQIALEQETISLNLKIMVQLDFIFAQELHLPWT